jgi:hypothetical protein
MAEILRYGMEDLALELHEAYSMTNEPLRRFASAGEAIEALDLGVDRWGRGESTQLALWSPRLGPKHVERRELELEGNPTREELGGWGIIHVFLGGIHEGAITPSRYALNSEKRALAWESAYADRFGAVEAWDWRELEAVSRRLRYHVSERLAAGKTRPPVHYVLRHADRLTAAGHRLTDGARRTVPYR